MINELDDSLRVREANVNDIQPIYNFLCDLVEEKLEMYKFSRAFMLNITNPNYIYLVAEYKTKVAGFLSFNSRMMLQHGGEKTGEILDLFVKVELRNKGVGKLLLDKLRMLCRTLKVYQIEVSDEVAKKKSHNFYLKEGFVVSQMKFVYKMDPNDNEDLPLDSE